MVGDLEKEGNRRQPEPEQLGPEQPQPEQDPYSLAPSVAPLPFPDTMDVPAPPELPALSLQAKLEEVSKERHHSLSTLPPPPPHHLGDLPTVSVLGMDLSLPPPPPLQEHTAAEQEERLLAQLEQAQSESLGHAARAEAAEGQVLPLTRECDRLQSELSAAESREREAWAALTEANAQLEARTRDLADSQSDGLSGDARAEGMHAELVESKAEMAVLEAKLEQLATTVHIHLRIPAAHSLRHLCR